MVRTIQNAAGPTVSRLPTKMVCTGSSAERQNGTRAGKNIEDVALCPGGDDCQLTHGEIYGYCILRSWDDDIRTIEFNSIQVPLSGPVALSMEYQKKIRSEQKATSAGPSRTTSRAINVAGKSVTFFTKLVQSS